MLFRSNTPSTPYGQWISLAAPNRADVASQIPYSRSTCEESSTNAPKSSPGPKLVGRRMSPRHLAPTGTSRAERATLATSSPTPSTRANTSDSFDDSSPKSLLMVLIVIPIRCWRSTYRSRGLMRTRLWRWTGGSSRSGILSRLELICGSLVQCRGSLHPCRLLLHPSLDPLARRYGAAAATNRLPPPRLP